MQVWQKADLFSDSDVSPDNEDNYTLNVNNIVSNLFR